MTYYCGIDLHARNNYLVVIDDDRKKYFERRLMNDLAVIIQVLETFKDGLYGVAVESTYNWYWLVDGLQDSDYKVHLANPSAMKKYSDLKYSDDHRDAVWLAWLLKLGILPEGYIYPRAQRAVRDLLRKRGHLVRLRTSLLLGLQNQLVRDGKDKLGTSKLKSASVKSLLEYVCGPEAALLSSAAGKRVIDAMSVEISGIEREIKNIVKLKPEYVRLSTLPGVGEILATTIMLETGPISRFDKVGDYVSYCRKTKSVCTSNGRVKAKGNSKNGNKYLSWAYSEAAVHAQRWSKACSRFYNRKLKQRGPAVAHNALAHKLARAAYFIMRENVPYDESRLFGY
jgi:transposase